jgi:hypothetical protein
VGWGITHTGICVEPKNQPNQEKITFSNKYKYFLLKYLFGNRKVLFLGLVGFLVQNPAILQTWCGGGVGGGRGGYMWRDPEDSFVLLDACPKQLSDRPIDPQVLMNHSHWSYLTSCVDGEESVFVTCWVRIEIKKFANPCRSIAPSS